MLRLLRIHDSAALDPKVSDNNKNFSTSPLSSGKHPTHRRTWVTGCPRSSADFLTRASMWSVARRVAVSAVTRASAPSSSSCHIPGWSFSRCHLSVPNANATRQVGLPPRATRSFRTGPHAHALNLGAVAASVGVRALSGVAVKTVQLRAARGAYRGLFSDRARLEFRHLLFGATAAGSAARLVVVASGCGAVVYLLIDTVPLTGRRRLILFDAQDEHRLGDVAAAAIFQSERGNFLPPNDKRVQRVAAVAWQLVNRLTFADLFLDNVDNGADGAASASSQESSTSASSTLNKYLTFNETTDTDTHPLFRSEDTKPWTVHVIDHGSEVNAFTVPGGHVFVTTGTLDMVGSDDNALAFIIGHEIGHALCRHGAEKATSVTFASVGSLLSWATAIVVGNDYFGGAFTATALVGAENAVTLAVTLPNSRDMEREADLVGVRLCRRACFDAKRGAARTFALLKEMEMEGETNQSKAETKASRKIVEYLSTHPLDEARSEATRKAVSELEFSNRENQQRKQNCASFAGAVGRCVGFSVTGYHPPLPKNAEKRNFGKVLAPSETWRLAFVQNVDAKIAESPRGVTGALDAASNRGTNRDTTRQNVLQNKGTNNTNKTHGPVGSGPVGRFDLGRLRSIASGFGRVDTDAKIGEKKRVAENSKTLSTSRAWKGPVRRKREIETVVVEQEKETESFPVAKTGAGDDKTKTKKQNAKKRTPETERAFGDGGYTSVHAKRALRKASRAGHAS